MITENNFTSAELAAALDANPALIDVMKETATQKSLFLYKKEELDSFVEGERTKAINDTTSKIYSQIDQDVASLTGSTKGNEKTYEFVKRVIAETKKKATDLEGEKILLEEQVKKGGDVALKTKYEALELEHKKLNEELIPSLNKKLFETKIESLISEAQRGLKFNPAYDQTVVDTLISVAKSKMIQSAKAENDAITFYDGEGKPFMNGINVAKPEEVFLKFLPANVLDTVRPKPGTGTTPPGSTTSYKNADGKDIVVPSDVKTKVQLHEFLIGQGLQTTSKEFMDIDKEFNLPTV